MRITQILQNVAHRPWEISHKPWRFYQEWNNAVFLHWKVSPEVIHPLIPSTVKLDTFRGEAWVSLVAFTMEKLRVSYLPAVPGISNFHEINLRTYVTRDNKPGVYFLSIEAQKLLAVLIAKNISGLPYKKALIKRDNKGKASRYSSVNAIKGFVLDSIYEAGEQEYERAPLDKWLVERYCLYLDRHERLFRYDIHHLQWEIRKIDVKHLNLQYKVGDLVIKEKQPDLSHFSPGVKVLAWPRISVS